MSDQSNGSFARLLPDKTPEVRSAIKKLLKVYTMPPEQYITDSRPTSGHGPQLVGDPQASPPYISPPSRYQEPVLPSNFLYQNLCHDGTCAEYAEYVPQHCQNCQDCLTRMAMDESDWVTANGFTMNAQRIRMEGPMKSDLSIRDRFGNSVFHLLAAHDTSATRCLVSNYRNNPVLNARNSANQTFLHILFSNLTPFHGLDQESLCALLNEFADAGVDVKAEDCYGRTAFHLLVWGGLPRQLTMQLAARYGEDVMRQRDALGLYPLLDIYQSDMDIDEPQSAISPEIPQNVFIQPPSPVTDILGARLPQVFEEAQLKGCIDSGLQGPFSYQGGDAEGRNPLHCLALKTISQKTLEGNAAHLEYRDAFYTAEEVDAKTGPLQIRMNLLRALLDNGVNPNQYDSHGNTPLMMFAAYLPQSGDYSLPGEILQVLIDAGADIEARNRAGETALLVAARSGNKLAVKKLTMNKANVHVTDAEGRGVLQVVDAKMRSVNASTTKIYARYEAIRAWLSGVKNQAVQNPRLIDEWSVRR